MSRGCGGCGAHVQCWHDCDGVTETLCDDCSEPCCSACAAWFDIDGGYGEDGQDMRVHALCKTCDADTCGRCHRGYKAGAADLCQVCNERADREENRRWRELAANEDRIDR